MVLRRDVLVMVEVGGIVLIAAESLRECYFCSGRVVVAIIAMTATRAIKGYQGNSIVVVVVVVVENKIA